MGIYRNRNQGSGMLESILGQDERVELNPLMQKVYTWMLGGLGMTTLVAALTLFTPLLLLAANPIIFFSALIAQIGLVWWLSARVHAMPKGRAQTVFFAYAGLNGFTLSLIVLYYGAASVIPALLTTVGLFGAMSVIGLTTKTDLTKMGTYLMMGLIGLFIAMIVNIFLNSSALEWIISIVGVLIFTGLTAYDTQRINEMANARLAAGKRKNDELVGDEFAVGGYQFDGQTKLKNDDQSLAIMGALILYLDFINLFLFLLRLFGVSRD